MTVPELPTILFGYMKIQALQLCEHVATYTNGTFTLVNAGVSKFEVPSVPVLVSFMVFVQAEHEKGDSKNHRFDFSLRDVDGVIYETQMPNSPAKASVRVTANVAVDIKPEHPDDEPVIVNFGQGMPIVFDRPGTFYVRVDVDSQSKQVPLKIVLVQKVN